MTKSTLQYRNWISRMLLTATNAALAFAPVLALAVATIATQPAQAQTFTTLATFDGTNGGGVVAPLVQATDGNLYGTAELGGANGEGTVFNITTGGTLTPLYSFCSQPNCADGGRPVAGLVLATNGDLYGTTEWGGATNGNDSGTIFKYALSTGTFTSIYDFCTSTNCGNGTMPTAGLMQASNGDLYGTTSEGGSFGPPEPGNGTVFQITETGKLTQLYVFCGVPPSYGGCASGHDSSIGWAPTGGLVQATNGILYGTTSSGGNVNDGGGTIFKITTSVTDSVLTSLYDFCSQANCTDGDNNDGPGNGSPSALVQATNGNLFGTTAFGGAKGAGVVFEITPAGEFTTLYSFCSQSACADGSNPEAGLIQGTDGNLYGTTSYGGNYYGGPSGYCGASYGCGTIFQITLSGTLTTLYSFCSQPGCADGVFPVAGLVQNTNGTFYGTTWANSTVFSLSTGLGPFVKTVPASGAVGKAVTILGTNLTGATGVSFNGIPATTVKVVSSSEITATVPTGATPGYVTVTTPSGTLTSNLPFRLSAALISTTSSVASSLNPSTLGESVTFTATVSSGAGAPPNGETISFMKGTTVLGTGTLSGGTASFTTSTLPVGTSTVKAVYSADAYFKGSTATVKQVVEKAAD